MAKILIIDDDPDLCTLVGTILKREGYEVEEAYDGKGGIAKATETKPDLILLDVMIPGESGWDICEELRSKGKTPIIFLSARGAETDIVRGLQLGADDYIAKPFRRHEMIARIEAVLRRAQAEAEDDSVYEVGDLVVNHTLYEVHRGAEEVALTPTEFDLLLLLAQNAGKPVAHNDLLGQVWDESQKGNLNLLKVYIRQLRRKVEPDPNEPRYILTKRGVGYRLAAPE
jgi:DNA-binding response OmpR family regulator